MTTQFRRTGFVARARARAVAGATALTVAILLAGAAASAELSVGVAPFERVSAEGQGVPDVSGRLVGDKVDRVHATGAGTVLGGDLGCLLNIAGKLRREGSPVKVYHAAELLAGMLDEPGIGEG